jgi:proton-dependent oligopeptide transporter, POT family
MSVLKTFPRKFWIANTLELIERYAWYGMFMILALYLTESRETGALGFSQAQKGSMMGIVVGTLYLMPLITGALADRFGFRRMLFLAFAFSAAGYTMMGSFTSFWGMFIAFFVTAIGAGLFKPIISASIARTTNKTNSSIGFGVFYMMVNIGAFIGPITASKLRETNWSNVFYFAAILMLINALMTLFFFSKDIQDNQTKISVGKEIKTAFRNIGIALSDLKFVFFLLIVIGFWTMYNQLFYTLPVFINDWMDTGIVYDNIYKIWPWLATKIGTKQGTIAPEMMTNIDAMYIIIFQLLVSWAVMKWRPINAMMTGFLISAIGLGLTFMQSNPMYLFATILIFGLGEMASSPKITEYIGKIAPKDKVALYMGCSFLPMAGGNYLAGWLSGSMYGRIADKSQLLISELSNRGFHVPQIGENFTKTDLFLLGQQSLNMGEQELTQFLWETYSPSSIWTIFTGIGILCFIMLFIYDKTINKSA